MKTNVSALLLAALFLFSCSTKKEEPTRIIDPVVNFPGVYVLNNGAFEKNNASISLYDPETRSVTANAFSAANDGMPLGDTAQDMIAVGEELYISVNVSKVVFVTDRNLKIKKSIVAKKGETTLSPRYLCSGNGKVYVTYYEGYLGEINPSTYEVKLTEVGPNPDAVVWCSGKIFTADSGGYQPGFNNTVSVINPATLQQISTITVNTDPSLMCSVGKNLFVFSYGDYNNPAVNEKVQCIDAETFEVKDLTIEGTPASIASDGSKLYVLCSGYDTDWQPLPGTVWTYDAATLERKGKFVTDGTILPKAYSLSVSQHYLAVGCSDYTNTGDVYLFDLATGKKAASFDSKGINPLKVLE